MPIMDRIWVKDDGMVVAMHGPDQTIPAVAYPDTTLVLAPNGAIQPVTMAAEGDRMMPMPTILPANWRELYPEPIPERVSKLGLRRALREAGKLAAFDKAVAAASENDQDDYQSGVEFSTSDAVILALLKATKIADKDVGDLMRSADALVR